jgi:hypothetical protein
MPISLSKLAVLSMGLCIGAGMALASDSLVSLIEKDVSDAGKGGVSNVVQDVKKTVGVAGTNVVTNAVSGAGVVTTNVPKAVSQQYHQRVPTNAPSSGTLSSEAHSAGHAVATNAVGAVEGLLGNVFQ